MNGNAIINSWALMVESSGGEMSVTLLVSGRRITGFLTPYARYSEWEKEVMARARVSEGGFTPPSNRVGPISPELIEQARSKWSETLERLQEERGLDVGEGEYIQVPFVCLRDATIHEGIPMQSTQVPMLLVRTSSVDACHLGAPND